jgi:sugar-specific transcriptional regulator TrmB
MNKLVDSLISLGLTEKQARLYITLYELGEATAYEIAKKSGLKRPTVYVIMEELRKRGLALIIPHPKKQVFIAKDPHEFIGECQSKVSRDAKDIFTMLPKLSRPDSKTIVFKGEGALAQGLSFGLHSIKDKKLYAFYAGIGKKTTVTNEYTEHFEELYKLGFKVKSIVPSNSLDEKFREEDVTHGFETKRISSDLFSPSVSVEICGSIVKSIFHKKKEVVVIEDKELADFYIQLFEIVWLK